MKVSVVILSDEFKRWTDRLIKDSFALAAPFAKMQNSLSALLSGYQFKLPKGFKHLDNGLIIRVEEASKEYTYDAGTIQGAPACFLSMKIDRMR